MFRLQRNSLSSLAILIALVSLGGGAVHADEIVAVVNGHEITRQDVDATIAERLHALEQQMYALREGALQNVIAGVLIEHEAKKQKLSVDQLRAALTSVPVTVPVDEIEKKYKENQSFFQSMSAGEAKERLRLDLEAQERMRHYRTQLDKLRAEAAIDIRLEPPRVPASPRDDAAPSLGSKEAQVVVTMYSDYECPYCKAAQETVHRLVSAYKDDVRLVYKNLPIDGHDRAMPAARAAFCAQQQGAFWPFHNALFAGGDLAEESLRKTAASVGMERVKFAACVESEASLLAVENDIADAKRAGIRGTPAFVVNGRVLRGNVPFETLQKAVQSELATPRTAAD